MRWFMMMSRWARNPPSEKKVLFFLGVLAICLVIFGIEKLGWWPDWATADRVRPGVIR